MKRSELISALRSHNDASSDEDLMRVFIRVDGDVYFELQSSICNSIAFVFVPRAEFFEAAKCSRMLVFEYACEA